MKKILFSIFLLAGITTFAQNIKTKKNQILFDDKAIANYELSKKWYTISDVNGQEIIKIKPSIHVISELQRAIYYEILSPDETINVSVYNKGDKSSISFEKKFLYDFTLGDYKLFTPNGIDLEVVNKLLNSNLNVKEELLSGKNEADKESNRIIEIAKNNNVDFNFDGEVFVNRKNVGTFKRKKGTGVFSLIYEIYDTKGKLIGKWEKDNNNTLSLSNGKNYTISSLLASPENSLNSDKIALIVAGYAIENNLLTSN